MNQGINSNLAAASTLAQAAFPHNGCANCQWLPYVIHQKWDIFGVVILISYNHIDLNWKRKICIFTDALKKDKECKYYDSL